MARKAPAQPASRRLLRNEILSGHGPPARPTGPGWMNGPGGGGSRPYLRVAADLREKIASGELLPGEQVPSLDRLAETYRISRTTARRAVQVLMDEGLVVSRPRWGVFVAERR